MGGRLQTKLTVSPELAKLLEDTKDYEMTAEEVQAQRESFARSVFPDEMPEGKGGVMGDCLPEERPSWYASNNSRESQMQRASKALDEARAQLKQAEEDMRLANSGMLREPIARFEE